MDTFTLIQYVFLFGLSIVFSTVSLNRQTMMTFLLAGISWVAMGLTNFTFSTNPLSTALSYIFVALGLIFFLASIQVLGEAVMDKNEERWKVGL